MPSFSDLQDKITRRGLGRPITKREIERKVKEVLGKRDESLDWSFEPEERSLKGEGWNDKCISFSIFHVFSQ